MLWNVTATDFMRQVRGIDTSKLCICRQNASRGLCIQNQNKNVKYHTAALWYSLSTNLRTTFPKKLIEPILPNSPQIFPSLPKSSQVFPNLPMSSQVFPNLPKSSQIEYARFFTLLFSGKLFSH